MSSNKIPIEFVDDNLLYFLSKLLLWLKTPCQSHGILK